MIAEIVILTILGAGLPASDIQLPPVEKARLHTVQWYDQKINLSNRVLDRSIRAESLRVQADLNIPCLYTDPDCWDDSRKKKARHQQASAEEHCKFRLTAEGIANPAGKCGTGIVNSETN